MLREQGVQLLADASLRYPRRETLITRWHSAVGNGDRLSVTNGPQL